MQDFFVTFKKLQQQKLGSTTVRQDMHSGRSYLFYTWLKQIGAIYN